MDVGMKNLIRIEEAFFVFLAIYLFTLLDYAWWWFLLLFFAPDLTFIAYIAGPRAGGIVYDLVHHRGLLIGLYILGSVLAIQTLQLIALVFLAHSSFDRIFGYGLKYLDSPNHTHLGMIGKEARS
jgi:hypothetical protein